MNGDMAARVQLITSSNPWVQAGGRRIILIRHAECVMNLSVDKYIGGRSNSSPLTEKGTLQAAALAASFAHDYKCTGTGLLQLYSSTAVRALETAAAIATGLNMSLNTIIKSEKLLELDQGKWEGELRSVYESPEVKAALAHNAYDFAPPQGESQRQVEDRMMEYITNCILPSVPLGGTALIVSHGVAIKLFLRRIMDADAHFLVRQTALDNCSVSVVSNDPTKGWFVHRINDVSPLLLFG